MPLVEKRYAEALIEVAVKNNTIDVFQQGLKTVADIFNQQADFKYFFLNPEIKGEIKKDTIKKLFAGNLKAELVNFLLLLLDKGRVGYLDGIYKEYVELADKIKNVLYMTIVSAAPLEETQISAIKEKYRNMYNAVDVKTSIEVDKSLLGGVKVKIGDKVIDGSVEGRIRVLKQLIIGS